MTATADLPLPLEVPLRRLAQRLQEQTRRLLAARLATLEPRWLPVVVALGAESPQAVTELARQLGLSHPAVLQVADAMLAAGWLVESRDAADRRRRLLSLSPHAVAQRGEVDRLLAELRAERDALSAEIGDDLERIVLAADAALAGSGGPRGAAGARARRPSERGGQRPSSVDAPAAGARRRAPTAPPAGDFEVWR